MALELAPTVTSRACGAPAAELVEHYEGLRLRGLHPPQPPRTIAGEPGLGVLVAHGMRAWMDVVWIPPRSSVSASDICTAVPGAMIDAAIGELLVKAVTPMALEVALAVEHEVRGRLDQADRLRLQHVERARYEADLARRRYTQVDPDNRLVADSLEAEWNAKLRAITDAQQTYERERAHDRAKRDPAERDRILALARDFPAVWRDPNTPDRERKRMARLLVEDVTLRRGEDVTLHVRFRGGATTTLTLPRPRLPWELRTTDPAVGEPQARRGVWVVGSRP